MDAARRRGAWEANMAIATLPRARVRRMSPAAEPNVIPFIDVLLVLLIIFMVTAPKPTTDLRLDLPSSGRSIPLDIAPTIVDIAPNADGGARLLLDGYEVALDELNDAILRHVSTQRDDLGEGAIRAEARVFVRADLEISYAHVVAVIDQLQNDGFERVGVFAQLAD